MQVALTGIALLAAAMVAFYWVSWRTRKTENDVGFGQKAGTEQVEEKSDFAGIYSTPEPFEGEGQRLGFFTLNRKEDGSGYSGVAKLDLIASTQESPTYVSCGTVNIDGKDFFLKCVDPALGQISFTGEWRKGPDGIQLDGKLLWSKDGAVINDKAVTLSHRSS